MALIDIKETDVTVSEIAIDRVIADPNQPRRVFDNEKIKELASSIKQQGLISPITVREEGDKFIVVAGERRYRAHLINKSSTINCILYTGDNYASISVVENLQREDLKPVEEARGVKSLMEEMGLSQSKAGDLLGKSRVAINQLVKIVSLPSEIQEESLTLDTSKAVLIELALLTDKELVLKLWKKAKKGTLTVLDIRNAKAVDKKPSTKAGSTKSLHTKAINSSYLAVKNFTGVEKSDLTEGQKAELEELKKYWDGIFSRLID
jgi:ParB family chromosome partitioning protein